MIISNNEQKPSFGDNEGVWEYRTFDNELLGYSVRKKKGDGKRFVPWSFQDNEWVMRWYDSDIKPIYNAQLLKIYPEKSVLIVEGEKTADAATKLLPDFVCVTWMGGSSSAGKIDTQFLEGRKVCIWPDNDEPGYKAAEKIKSKLKNIASYVGVVNPKNLGVDEKWDLADYDENYGLIDWDTIVFALECAGNKKDELELIDSSSFPLLSAKGNPINAYENLDHLLKFYGMTTRYNTIKKDIEVDIPHKNFTKANKAKLILTELISLCIKNNVPRIDIPQWLMMIADQNYYNPVDQYLKSKPWDGISRINDFLNTIDCDDLALRNLLVSRWMIGAIAAGLSVQGLAPPGVLTICGPQYCGKSSWFKSLLPNGSDLLLADYSLNPSDKDLIRTATRFWLTELSEVDAAVRKSDVSAMKSFLTRTLDVYRCPYDRADTEAPRNTAFVATVNDPQFLRDTSGNRRWWVLEVNKLNAEHNLDMQQVWAEFYNIYLNGQTYHLEKDEFEMLNITNKKHTTPSSMEEILKQKFNWHEPMRTLKMTATEVLNLCGFDIRNNKGEQIKECHRLLRELTNELPKTIRGNTIYYLPPINNQATWI